MAKFFPYYFADAGNILNSPKARIVIDDGRRFLERSQERFDVIIVDPPPPLESAGSSLLYSKEFYEIVKKRLYPSGILQQWFYSDEPAILASVARAIQDSFQSVRVFRSTDGCGYHFLASSKPIHGNSSFALAKRLSLNSEADLLEWNPNKTAEQQFRALLDHEVGVEEIIIKFPKIMALEDDHPINEYFLLRRKFRFDWTMPDPAFYQAWVNREGSVGRIKASFGLSKSTTEATGGGFSAVMAQETAFRVKETGEDFLRVYLIEFYPKTVSSLDLQTIRNQIQTLSNQDSLASYYKRGMLFFFLAVSESVKLAEGKDYDPEEVNMHWRMTWKSFEKSRDIGLSMKEQTRLLLQSSDTTGDSKLDKPELISMISSRIKVSK